VQVTRAEALRDDAPRLLPHPVGEPLDPLLVLRCDVDERLDTEVVALAHLREQLLERALRREIRVDAAGEDLGGAVLRLLHVRLVEGVDPEDRACDGGGELPAEELLPELVRIREAHLLPLTVRAVRVLARRGDEPLALLARRLRDQLLRPQAEAAG